MALSAHCSSFGTETFWRLGTEDTEAEMDRVQANGAEDGEEDDMEWEDVQPGGLGAAVPTK
eukprot:scaffold33285_cov48-Prasinocladus_malaysianus.AAC.1